MLDNITVVISDLQRFVPDINDYKFSETVNFDQVINEQKRKLYGMVKEDYRGGYNTVDSFYSEYGSDSVDTILENIKDYPQEQYLKNRLIRMSLAEVFRSNKEWDDMSVWEEEANKIPIKYFLDTDDSGTVGFDEEITSRRYPTFHR